MAAKRQGMTPSDHRTLDFMPIGPSTFPAQVLLSFDREDKARAHQLKRDIEERTHFEVHWVDDRQIESGDSLQAKTIPLVFSSFVIVLIGTNWGAYQELEVVKATQMGIPTIGVLVSSDRTDAPQICGSLSIPLVKWGWQEIVPIIRGDIPSLAYERDTDASAKNPSSIILLDFKDIAAAITREIDNQPDALHSLSPRQFEQLVAYLMEQRGYEVRLTQQSRDGGVDIFAVQKSDYGEFLTIVDCKKYAPNRPVGVELVRSMYGTLTIENASHAIVATTSRFTDAATAVANTYRYRISLKDCSDILNWIRKT